MNKLDKQGEAARDLYKKITTEGADYNERRKEQTVILRNALTPVWAALKSGKPVNGCSTIRLVSLGEPDSEIPGAMVPEGNG